MVEPLVMHQIIEYRKDEPFYVDNVTGTAADDLYVINSHWHEELELAYILQGHYSHYIDGERIEAEPGRMIVTNCGSIHRIDPRANGGDIDEHRVILLIVHNRFIEENFPEYRNFRFKNEKRQARPEIRDIMLQFSDYRSREAHQPNEHLYMRGLLLQLLYYLYLEGADDRSAASGIGHGRQLQKVREILQYVESHYQEDIAQAEVAAKFYFTPQYFSRLFKSCTGMTFTEHLTRYRLERAEQELMHSDRLIFQIARNHGFKDDRSFISAFKRIYGMTPLQYKKVHRTRLSPKEDKKMP